MSSSSSACSIATKNKSHRERWRVNKRNPASWLALVLAPQWLKRSLYRQSQYCTPMALPVRWHEPAGSFCCQSNTELSVHMALTDSVVSSSLRVSMHTHTNTHSTAAGSIHTFHQIHTCSLYLTLTNLLPKHTFHTLVLTVKWVAGLMPNVLHYPSRSEFCIYLHRWQCRCCWRLFCTGPEQEPCGGGGKCADPTKSLS